MESPTVRTIDRFVEVLDCFTMEQPAWSLAELSIHLHIPKSTLHRFLMGLETHGVLRRAVEDKRWRLGYHLVLWGNIAAESTALRDLARPVMCRLMEASGETAILTVYQSGMIVCIALCETPHAVQLRMAIGASRPAHAGASSKVLIAYLPVAELEALIRDNGLPKLCSNTITDWDRLQADLACIVHQGYSVSLEETDEGAWGVATPIFDSRGRVVAAIGLAGPTTRYSEEKIRQWAALCRGAADIIGRLIQPGGKSKS